MSTVHDDTIDEAVSRFAPTTASLGPGWGTARQDAVLAGIIGDRATPSSGIDVVHELLIDAPVSRARRRRALLPLAASIAVFAAGAGTLLAVLPGRSGSDAGSVGTLPPGQPFDPPAGLSAKALPAGSWAYNVQQLNDVDAKGRIVRGGKDAATIRSWMSARGDVYESRSGAYPGCTYRPNRAKPSLDAPTAAFFRSLPTDVAQLQTYLQSHVNGGSSSRDAAVFVEVRDALSAANGLASPRLRAAFVAVLSRTPGVILHRDAPDQLGHAVLRLDFVDQQIRPDEVQSMFFSPTDFSLLEQRDGSNGAPNVYDGPSPAYTHSASTGRDPNVQTGAASVQLFSGGQVVKHLPASLRKCPTSTGNGG